MNQDTHDMDFSRYLHAAFAACDGAGRILSHYFGNLRRIDEKFQAGLVSEADRESEKLIVTYLRSQFPDHSFLGEEYGFSQSEQRADATAVASRDNSGEAAAPALWLIDPLDGTTNYVHQFPVFCISLGLEIAGEMRVGVVDAPKLGFRYHAVKGQGAYLNGERIRVSSRKVFREGLFATGFSSHDDQLDQQLSLLSLAIREARGIRRAGAAALDLCFVAQGIFDAFWERNLEPWDTAAGTLIAREAGAHVTDMEGGDFNPRCKSILCGNPDMHREVLAKITELASRS